MSAISHNAPSRRALLPSDVSASLNEEEISSASPRTPFLLWDYYHRIHIERCLYQSEAATLNHQHNTMTDSLKVGTNSRQLETNDAADRVIVDWESGDPEDSMNWPPSRKWLTMALVSSLALVT